MAYRIELAPEAVRDLRKLDRQAAIRVQRYLRERVGVLDDPRSLGGALVGVPYWRYRVGDYRILAEIQDAVLLPDGIPPPLRSAYRRHHAYPRMCCGPWQGLPVPHV